MKAILLCGSCFFVVSNSFPITSTNAGDFQPLGSVASVLPDTAQGTLDPALSTVAVLPQVLPESAATQKAVLPTGDGVVIDQTVVPGENPFVKRSVQGNQQGVAPSAQASSSRVLAGQDNAQPAQGGTPVPGVNPFAATGANEQAAAGSDAGKAATPKVDETALRYYASTQDLKRLGAELRRLKALYPEWETPDNLFDPVTTVQEQPLWDLYGKGQYAAVRAELSRLQTANPQWKPSKDLMTKLHLAEVRKVIDRSFALKNWPQVIQMGRDTPDLLVCANMNVLWQVGEALAQTRDYARAFDLYKYVLTSCTDPGERLATVQKASLLLPEAGLQSLIALGSILPDGTSEFEAVGFDPLRRKMGKVAAGETFPAPITTTELEIFSDFVQRTGAGDDAGLFGWYYYGQKDYEASHAWFLTAMRLSNHPKNIEGVVLSLRNMGKTEEALAFAKRYGKTSPEVTKEYIEIISASLTSENAEKSISDEELATFEKAVFAIKSATGAQALGWKKLKEKDSKGAKELFKTSLAWGPTEGAVIGSAVIATRAKDRATLASLKATYGNQYDGLEKLSIYTKRASSKHVNAKKPRNPRKEPKGFFQTLFAKREP